MSGNRTINTGGGNYNERIEGDYIQGNYIYQSGNFGIGANKGEIKTEKLSGNINEIELKTLTEAAAEIQQLLEQLEKSYPTDTTKGKMVLATETIQQIENNPKLMARILSALKVGGVKAFEELLSHPAASFLIGALEDWERTNS